MARQKLTGAEIEERLSRLKDWTTTNNKLARKYKFENFAKSLKFINQVGALAEKLDHHPDILFGWGYAEIFITTHDAGGITEKDFELASKIQNVLI